MSRSQPLKGALELSTYEHKETVRYRLVRGKNAESGEPIDVQIPLPIAYRIHYLGRAYDGQAVKSLWPTTASRIDFLELQRLRGELELVERAVCDPVALHYLRPLIALLRQSSAEPGCCLAVSPSDQVVSDGSSA